MKQNYKIRILVLGCFVFGLFIFVKTPVAVAATCHDIHGKCTSLQVCYAGVCATREFLGIPAPTNGGTCGTNNSDVIKAIQTAAGMGGNDVDGICGSDTITAIQVFQENNGITPPDGVVTMDGTTIKAMQLEEVAGDDCGSGFPICGVGLTCVNSVCAVPGASSGTPPANPNNPNPTNPTTSVTCPAGLTNVNGLCLPPNQFTTGIASKTTLTDFLLEVVKILLSFAGVIAVVMLVLGGYWYMASGGNEETAEKGKKTIINFVLGLVVIILAYTIVTVISSTLTGGDKLVQ